MFCGDYIIPLEIKFSKLKEKDNFAKPKWNSNLPKSNSFYIFAKQNENLVIFKGGDFIDDKARIILQSFFNEINSEKNNLLSDINEKLKNLNNNNSNEFGLYPYIRKDFIYKKEFCSKNDQHEISIFETERKNQWYQNVVKVNKWYFLKLWILNLINFILIQ